MATDISDEATPLPTVEAVTQKAPRGMWVGLARVGRSVMEKGVVMARSGVALAKRRPRTASLVAGVTLAACLAPLALRPRGASAAPPPPVAASPGSAEPQKPSAPAPKPYQPVSSLAGVDLRAIAVDDAAAIAPAGSGKFAKLTLDPKLQLAVTRLLAKYKLPQAAAVMIEPQTGKVLAYASKEAGVTGKDLNVEAFAPSASVFKIVTGSALVQVGGIGPDYKSCYSGGEQKIFPVDLKDDPKRDQWCATLAQAMGRSINTIFARLASKKLTAPDLNAIASQMGYGAAIPFDVPLAVSRIDLPTDTLGFARTAAGFWNTTLSPLHGALLAATIANGGVTMRPYIVNEIRDTMGVTYKAPAPSMLRKALEASTAAAVEKMMTETVSQGTSFKAFHDPKGKSFLPGIEVAGKTGTLNQVQPVKLFTWFVGYAPVKNPKVAIAVLVVNDPVWKVKANVVAREALQAYFAQHGAVGVQSPVLD